MDLSRCALDIPLCLQLSPVALMHSISPARFNILTHALRAYVCVTVQLSLLDITIWTVPLLWACKVDPYIKS